MKRFHVAALAVAGALPAAAHAGVNIGGILDVGVRVDSGTTGGSVKSVGSGLETASRLTFSGIEDLGDGLQAGFVLEAGIAMDTGAGNSNPPGTATGPLTFGRTAAVALGSDRAGFVSLGRQYTPIWAVSAGPMNDPFGANWLGGTGTIYSPVPSGTVRASNSIVYSYGYTAQTMLLPAPKVGLGAAVMYAPSEVGSPLASKSGQQIGFNLSYGGDGTWWVGYAYHQLDGSNTAVNATAPVTDTPKLKQQTLGASYTVGPARLHVGFNSAKNDATGATAVDRRNWHLGAVVSLGGPHSLRVLYGKADDRTAANADFSTWQLGYRYELSKRSDLYVGAGQVDNSANALATLTGAVGSYAKGTTARSVITGLRHFF